MYGDIVYVERKPLLWRSTKRRENPNSKKMDVAIYRTMKYTHYGVDLGDGRIAHFQADSFWDRHTSTIVETTVENFVKDGTLGVLDDVPYQYSRAEVVQRAYKAMDTDFGGYSIFENNCEHFALWCATGTKNSSQYRLLKMAMVLVMNGGHSIMRRIRVTP